MEYLKEVKMTEKRYNVTDFLDHTNAFSNITVTKDGLSSSKKIKRIYAIPNSKIYSASRLNDKVVALDETGGVFFVSKSGSVKNAVTLVAGKYNVIPFHQGEDDRLLLIGANNSYLISESQITSTIVPNGICALSGEYLFVGNGNELRFELKSVVENGEQEFNPLNVIKTPNEAGEIVGLSVDGKKLIIVCKSALLELTSFGEGIDFSLELIKTSPLSVLESSVKKVGDTLFFISDNDLYSYKNHSLKKVTSNQLFYGLKAVISVATGTCYTVLCSNTSSDQQIIHYDTVSGAISENSGKFKAIGDGGIVVTDKVVGEFSVDGESSGTPYWESKKIDFNLPDKKTIVLISVECDTAIYMDVLGGYGCKKLKFMKGFKKKKVNLTSENFTIKVTADEPIELENLRLSYTIMEG